MRRQRCRCRQRRHRQRHQSQHWRLRGCQGRRRRQRPCRQRQGVRHLRRQRLSGRQGPRCQQQPQQGRRQRQQKEHRPTVGSQAVRRLSRWSVSKKTAGLRFRGGRLMCRPLARQQPHAAEALAPAELARASPEASEAQALPAEAHPRAICRAYMLLEESRVALPCGHVLHEDCIQRYAECKTCPIEHACVFRCSPQPQLERPGASAT